jgi:cytochrome c oxidase subunit II
LLATRTSVIYDTSPTIQMFNTVYAWYWYLGVLSGVVTFAILGFVIIKYRAKKGVELAPEKQKENRQSAWKGPLLVLLLMLSVLIPVFIQTVDNMDTYAVIPTSSGPPLNIQVVGHQFSWTFIYPNGFVSEDLAVVPNNQVVVFTVTSADVYHQFGLPYFKVKTDAIPGRTNTLWIQPTLLGNYTVQCYELCGVGHAFMIGNLSVVSSATYTQWYTHTAGGT